MKRLILLNICLFVFKISLASAQPETGVKSEKIGLDLKKAVEMAIENNPRIIEAKESSSAASHILEATETLKIPKISAGYSLTQLDEQPYSSGTGMRIPVEDKTNFSWDITAVQPIFTGFAITSQCGIAGKNVEISKKNIDLVIADSAFQAKNAFISRLLAEKLAGVSKDSVESLKAHERDAQKFFDQGMIPYSDVLKAQVGLASASHNLENAMADLEISHQNLLLVINIPQNQDIEPVDIKGLPEKPEWTVYDEKAAFESRPEMSILRLQTEQIDHQIKLAESSLYPRVSLLGRYEQNGKDAGTTEHDYRNRFNSSVRLQADWTLFEGGRAIKERNALKSQKRAVMQKITGLENRIRLDLKESLARLRVAEANYKTASAALSQAKENWRITNLQFSQQMATASDVLDARLFLSKTEGDFYRSMYGCHIALASLARAQGRY